MILVISVIAIAYFGPPVLVLGALGGDMRLGLWYEKNPWPKALLLALIPGFARMALAIFLILGAKSLWIHYYVTMFLLLPEALSKELGLSLPMCARFPFRFYFLAGAFVHQERLLKEPRTKMNSGKRGEMKIVIPGGSGFCGRLLARHFAAQGHEIVVLSRRHVTIPGASVVIWGGETLGAWAKTLDGADAVINLAGRSVNCRYNTLNCAEIYASRLDSTRIIGEAITACPNPPRVWLNASSATIYRHAEDRPMDESTGELGDGFSVDVCRRWERELFCANVPVSVRRVALRSAMVFDAEPGGVWDAFAGLAKVGLGGAMAGGRQFVSWIHGEDFCHAVEWILTHDDLTGPINLAAPNPLPNRDFLAAVRRAVRVPFGIPSARWMLKIGAWLRGTETELLLKSRRVVPAKLLASGFRFDYERWQDAAEEIAHATPSRE